MNGQEIKYALKKATTWNTAIACGANNGLLMLPATITRTADTQIDDSVGSAYSLDGTPGAIKCEGDLSGYLRYDSCDSILAGLMGVAGSPTVNTVNGYDYIYDYAPSLDGIFYTLAKKMGSVYVREVPGVKFMSLTISGEAGQPLKFQAKILGTNLVEDGVNNGTTFANVTFFETENRIRFAQGVFRMNATSGAALSGGDAVKPSAFSLSITRKLSGLYGTNTAGTTNLQDVIDEPMNDGQTEFKLTLTFPRHTAKTYLTAWNADTRYKFDATFTGATIPSGPARKFLIQAPNMQLTNVNPVDAQGNIQEPLEFVLHGITTAPTGMTTPAGTTVGVTRPVRISGTNRLSTNPLA